MHEYTHAVQAAPWIGNDHPQSSANMFVPCLLNEGLPHVAGLTVGTSTFDEDLRIRKRLIKNKRVNTFKDYSSSGILELYKKDRPPHCMPPNPNYPLGYTIGFLTVEALSAIGGSESAMNLYKRTGAGETFQQAFKGVYGISWNEAEPILAEVVASMYE